MAAALVLMLIFLLGCTSCRAVAITPQASCPDRCRCDLAASLRRVDCSGLGLTNFPSNIHSSTQYLDLSENLIDSLPLRLENQVPQLETLILHHNKIMTLLPNTFQGLQELRNVDLDNNQLQGSLSPNLLADNPRMYFLSFSNNPSFNGTDKLSSASLEVLDISGCNVTGINAADFKKLPSLRALNVSLNPLIELPENLTIPELRVLDLTQCHLFSLPPNMLTGMPKLQQFHISKNAELDLPRHPPLLSRSLLKLTADHCNIQHASVMHLRALTHAYLSCNKITSIKRENFGRNSALLEIDLSQNLIRDLPSDVFLNASHLVSVDLSRNQIETLQYDTFACCKELKFVNLSRNDITNLPEFLTMPSVDVIDLSRCRLQALPENPSFLNSMTQLKQLRLAYNELQNIPDLYSKSLRALDVSYCHLTQVTNRTFSKLSELQRLDLSGNRLTSLNANVFDSNKKLATLKLDNNPWRCNCTDPEFQSLYDIADQLSETGRNQLQCNDPEEFAGQFWEDVCEASLRKGAETNSILLTVTLIVAMVALAGTIYCVKKIIGSDKNTARRENRRRHPQRRAATNESDSSDDDETGHPRVPAASSSRSPCTPCSEELRRQRLLQEVQPPSYEEAVLMSASDSNIAESSAADANGTVVHQETSEPIVNAEDEANEGDVSSSESEVENCAPKTTTVEVTVELSQQQTDL